MDILSKILNSGARVKIMRLFLLNKSSIFSNKDVAKRSRVALDTLRRELNLLHSVGFIKKRVNGWSFDFSFKYIKEFEGLLISADTLDKNALVEHFKNVGKMKLLVISGIFIKNKDTRVDLLLVGDKIKKSKLEEAIKKIEAEIGTELVYSTFETQEFVYRLNMYDKLVRDILDFPHQILFQSKEFPTHTLKRR